jgi:hypothetical protein
MGSIWVAFNRMTGAGPSLGAVLLWFLRVIDSYFLGGSQVELPSGLFGVERRAGKPNLQAMERVLFWFERLTF